MSSKTNKEGLLVTLLKCIGRTQDNRGICFRQRVRFLGRWQSLVVIEVEISDDFGGAENDSSRMLNGFTKRYILLMQQMNGE